MYIISSYPLAVVFCIITMLCWGSWANTQKLSARTWRYELFYWDYVIGIFLLSIVLGVTLGSTGKLGRSFWEDLSQVSSSNFLSAFIGGIIFNASNILLSAAISISGLAVAFPLGVGLALVLGVAINYANAPKGDPLILCLGVALIVVAIIVNGMAAGKMNKGGVDRKTTIKGIWLAICAGVLMSLFYRFVARAMDLNNFEYPTVGMVAPYAAVFIFALGVLASNFLFNTLLMKRPFVGEPVTYKNYFQGSFSTHLVGILGGAIWGLGTSLNFISAGKAGAAISYALGQGAPLIAALWGVFIWKEFKGASPRVNLLLLLMFLLFIGGLGLIITSGGN